MGILLFFQFCSIIPVDGVNISISQKTIQISHPITVSITGLQNGSRLRLMVEGNMTVPQGERFSVDIVNLTIPFSLRSATFTGVLEGSTDNTLTVQKGDYQVTHTGKGFVTSNIPFEVTGTIDHILLQGTSATGHVYMAPQISGIKEGPDDSQVSLALEGIAPGKVTVKAFVNDEIAFNEDVTVTPSAYTPPTAAQVATSVVVGAGLGIAGAAAAASAASATSATSGVFGMVGKGASYFMKDFISEHMEERVSDFEVTRRAIVIGLQQKVFLGFFRFEFIIAFIGAFLFGLATFISYKAPLTLQNIIIYTVSAGVAITMHEVAHWYAAHRKKVETDIKFWGLGTVIMFLTAWLVHNVFGQPCRTLISDVESMERRVSGEIMLTGPVVTACIGIATLPLIFAGGDLAQIGRLSFMMNLALALYHMMPFSPMDGEFVYKWNKFVWVGAFIPIVLLYILVFFI
jgi:Zn-dependent protease